MFLSCTITIYDVQMECFYVVNMSMRCAIWKYAENTPKIRPKIRPEKIRSKIRPKIRLEIRPKIRPKIRPQICLKKTDTNQATVRKQLVWDWEGYYRLIEFEIWDFAIWEFEILEFVQWRFQFSENWGARDALQVIGIQYSLQWLLW